jgi:hypothetical protein
MRLGDDERITPRESLHFVGMGRKKFTNSCCLPHSEGQRQGALLVLMRQSGDEACDPSASALRRLHSRFASLICVCYLALSNQLKFQQTTGSVLRDHFTDAAVLGIILQLLALRLASRPLSIFRGSWWLVGFGFNALMLVHETNQPPSYFNDSGDTSDDLWRGSCALDASSSVS